MYLDQYISEVQKSSNPLELPILQALELDSMISSIYVVYLDSSKVKFAIDVDNHRVNDSSDTLSVAIKGELYDDATPTMIEAFNYKNLMVENEFSQDKWGVFLSAYAPIFQGNKFVGLLGVDYNLASYQKLISHSQSVLYWMIFYAAIIALLMSSFSFVFILQVKKMMEKSSDIARFKEGYLAVLGHEMRTPLHGMIGIAQILESKLEGELKEDIKAISNIGHTLNSVVTEILEYSNHKTTVSHRFSMSIHEFIHELRAAISYKLSTVNQEIEIDFDPSIQDKFEIDSSRSILVCLSLLDNALKFASHKPKGIRIQKRFQALYFEVWDEGEGLPKGMEKRLGTEFMVNQNFLSSNSKGVGLGLALCAKRVALMGGELKYHAGSPGAIFYWSIPFVKSESPIEVERNYSKYHVLAVDDNKLNLKIINRLLEKLGLNVDLASSGVEAIELCNVKKFDLILMDIQMPEMDGMEASQLIKKIHEENNQYIIALTANALESEQKIYLENGLDGVIAKPINESVLKIWLDKIISK